MFPASALLAVLLLLAAAALVVGMYRTWTGGERSDARKRYDTGERQYMPRELADGTLVVSERYFYTLRPRPLGARFDQVFRTPDGFLVPVDTKRRKRAWVTDYDRIEISVQAAVLRNGRHRLRQAKVADHGYVRVAQPGGAPRYLRFTLLQDDVIAGLYDRYQRITSGQERPRHAAHVGMCRTCAYLPQCPAGQAMVAASNRAQRRSN